MNNLKKATGFEAGLTGDQQILVALEYINQNGGVAQMKELYIALENKINPNGFTLSDQGRASFRFYVNKVAVQAGYIYPHDKNNPGWRITPEGRQFLQSSYPSQEVALNVDTGIEEYIESSAAKGAAFELWILDLLRAWYPYYSWYHQGAHKHSERGLDFVGARIGDSVGEPRSIGVQVKFHHIKNAPTQMEWLKFLSGCFARRVEAAIFITTGRLTSDQRREAQEARVIVIEGRGELTRLAGVYNIKEFKLFD